MPYINPLFIEKLEEQIDIVKIIGEFVKLTKKGTNYIGLSPFTNEKSPSFTVSPTKEIFKDFSSGKGGGAIHFLMELKGMSYPEAIEFIAGRMNMLVEYDESEKSAVFQKRSEKKAELEPLMRKTIARYHAAFKALPPTHPAKLEVYGHRDYTDEIVDRWEIGFAPGRGYLYEEILERGLVQPAEELGIIKEGKDRFWNRVIYPIFDGRSKAIGIAGRDLGGGKVKTAKWINPDDSILYNKSQVLYGLHEAREHIYQQRCAYLVEGYNDVIAFQENGLKNTVSASGTSFTQDQMKMLRKIADKIILCFDGDAAGRRATMKCIPDLFALGFRVEVQDLLGCDPDELLRLYRDSIKKYGLPALICPVDAFQILIESLPAEAIDRARETKRLCETIALIDDEAMVEIYTGWLSRDTDFTKTKITKWVKDAREVAQAPAKKESFFGDDWMYVMPKGVKQPASDFIPLIERYGLFMANNQIWVMTSDEAPYHFKSVSNFSIEIIQHMQDEKFPMKLIRIKNIHGEEKIFDIPSAEINTPQSFDKAMTDQGNFFYKGGRNELQKLRSYLYDQMGTGRRIDVLGWQQEGFWAWNNKATGEDGEDIPMCENGIVKKDGTSFYIPSANKIYANNVFKYDAQKKVSLYKSPTTFDNYTGRMLDVHGHHAISGILFTLASLFQDIVVKELNFFPILFLYGPASSGKDQLVESCQSFFGVPQTAINLEGGVSTIKAQVREFAQFANIISHLSEYKRGDSKLDGVLKGLWDRRGYKRGNIDSHVGTESIPIISSVAMTGNDYPDNEALITRMMIEEMNRTSFTEDEVKRFEALADITKQGISSLADDLIGLRRKVRDTFKQKYRMFKTGFSETVPDAKSRMIANCSVLGSFYHILQDHITLPFNHNLMTDHFELITKAQMRKLASASITTRWWDCFLAAMRGPKTDRLQVRQDFKIENSYMYFNFTNAYNKIQRQWYLQYHESAPGKTQLLDTLRKETSYVEDVKSTRIGETNTSAILINMEHVPIKDELRNAMEWQLNERSLFESKAKDDEEPTDPTLPFNEPGDGDDNMPF